MRPATTLTGLTTAAAATWALRHQSSPAVRSWRPSQLPLGRTRSGLAYRYGSPEASTSTVVLLHGMVATGDVFGTIPDLLAHSRRVLVPDLLGFGRSLDESRSDFSTDAHLHALDELLDHAAPSGRISIGAHSMGSAIALRLAARHHDRVDRVVCIGAPIWPTRDAARSSLGRLGAMSRAFLFDEQIAQRICHFNCEHRTLAGYLSAIAAPRWPIPIARQASLHTWSAYIQTLNDQILECSWDQLIGELDAAGIPVSFIRGDQDPIGDPDYIAALADNHAYLTARVVSGDHTLPAADPTLLVVALGAPHHRHASPADRDPG